VHCCDRTPTVPARPVPPPAYAAPISAQDALKQAMGPARQYEVARPAEETKISASFWNRRTGAVESSHKPSSMQKRKHQINSLAFDCKERSAELQARAAQGFKTKAQTMAKYGW